MMQAASDIFLGWTSDEPLGVEFYVRILKNRRLGAVSALAEQQALSEYARLCGRTLARSHARSGDPTAIAGYTERTRRFDAACVVRHGLRRADAKDYAALVKAKGSLSNPETTLKTVKPERQPRSRRGKRPERTPRP